MLKQSITITTKGDGKFTLTEPQELNKLNPKELLLYSTALCAGKTVTRLVEQKRVQYVKLEIKMSGVLDTEKLEGISKFASFNIDYNVECKHLDDQPKISHAIQLAHDKYCGGLEMCRKIAPVSHSISIVSIEVEA
uniref:OsmC family protein n=1 Tax=Alistipes sp. TaxID=1872444 RepID=UPI004057BC09